MPMMKDNTDEAAQAADDAWSERHEMAADDGVSYEDEGVTNPAERPDVDGAVERHVRLAETPFADGGLGADMFARFHAYLAEYALSTEGADYEPNDFERGLIEDFFAGLMGDEHLFGPIRTLLTSLSEAQAMIAADGDALVLAEAHILHQAAWITKTNASDKPLASPSDAA